MAGVVHAPVEVGDLIAGKYRVERVIGAGGMGVVVSATHVALDQKVAIKFLLSSHAKDEVEVARFAREARALAKIECENVARVIDVGTLDDGASYMVMEYLEGKDLSTILRERGPIPTGQALAWVLEALEAVIEAHAAGIVHRDLKPANLFLAQRKSGRPPIVKVLDFGISKAMTGAAAVTADMLALTKTAALLGSPLYMAPEQLRSVKDLDGRTDIWAIGVILYELLTAKPPFMAGSLGALVSSIQDDPPLLPHFREPSIPEEVSAIVVRCLAKKREDRYPTAAELAKALRPFATPAAKATEPLASGPAPATAAASSGSRSGSVSGSGSGVSNLATTTDPPQGAALLMVSPAAETTGPKQQELGSSTAPPNTGPRTTDLRPEDRVALGSIEAAAPEKRKLSPVATLAIVVGVGVVISIGAVLMMQKAQESSPTYAAPAPIDPPAPSGSSSADLPTTAPSVSVSATTTPTTALPPKIAVTTKPSAAPSVSAAAPPPSEDASIPSLPKYPLK